jgi:hypothetical protein
MTSFNDLALSAGVPTSAATLAVAMYAACSAAEKVARPEALREIGRVMKDPSWSDSARPRAIIERLFKWTFGERHLSWRCTINSCVATFLFCGLYATLYKGMFLGLVVTQWSIAPVMLIKEFVLFAILPDYIALAKTRFLIRWAEHRHLPSVPLAIMDVVCSGAISTIVLFLGMGLLGKGLFDAPFAGHWIGQSWDTITERYLGFSLPGFALLPISGMSHPIVVTVWHFFVISTLLTSIWMILILLSTTIIKLLAPIHHFAAWLFDVEKHPVQTIGIVAGALVMIGSLVWSVVKVAI